MKTNRSEVTTRRDARPGEANCWAGSKMDLKTLPNRPPGNPSDRPRLSAYERDRRRAADLARGAARDRLLARLDEIGDRAPTAREVDEMIAMSGEAFQARSCAAKLVGALARFK